MAINPELITTIRVDQLPDETLTLTNLFPHTVGTELKSATIQELVDLVATSIGVSGGVGYLPISVTDGQQLPDVPESPGFFLCGAGTFLNINGFPNIICTENLNAIMSLTDHWELAVEIPINPLSGSVQSVTGSAVDNTDPLNPVINEIIYGVQNIIEGTNITVDNTDPANPIISATGGGGTQTLAEVLVEGNITDGTDISISDGDKIVLDNGANLKKGTTDAGLGGSKGIALRCAVDYELKWEAGRLYVMGGDGFTIREVSHNFTTLPTLNDDDTKGFVVGSRWILDNGDVYVCADNTEGAAAWEFYSVGATPTLQQVTDNGNNETTNDVIVKNSENKISLTPRSIQFEDIDQEGSTILRFEDTDVASQDVFIRGLGGTMALLSDIDDLATPTLQEVLDNNHDLDNGNFFAGTGAGDTNTGTSAIGIGEGAASGNSGIHLNAFGEVAGLSNSGNDVNALGALACQFNEGNHINALGNSAALGNLANNVNAFGFNAGNDNTFNNVNLFGENAQADENGQTVLSKDGTIMARISTTDLTASRKYTLQDADGTIAFLSDITGGGGVPYTGATQDLDLGTHKLLAKDLVINHPSGSGDAATITKGGSGEALKVVKTSGSGNAASITGGVTLIDELHLTTDLADAYIASASTWNAKQNALSYTPYKNIQTSQTAHTGTTAETNIFTATIPANSFNSQDVIKVLFGINKTTSLAAYTLRLRLSTTNNPTGGTLIALYTGGIGLQSVIMTRNYNLNGGNLYGVSFPTTILTDQVATNVLSSTALNPANQFFIHANISLANAGDSINISMLSIHN